MGAPAYDLQLEFRTHYLYARVTGPEDTVEVSIAYWREVAAACRSGAVRRLLVEELLEGRAGPGEVDEVVEGLLRMGLRDIRVAFVDATEDAAALVGAEIRAQRAGLVARVFRRVDEAEHWLLADLDFAADADVPAV